MSGARPLPAGRQRRYRSIIDASPRIRTFHRLVTATVRRPVIVLTLLAAAMCGGMVQVELFVADAGRSHEAVAAIERALSAQQAGATLVRDGWVFHGPRAPERSQLEGLEPTLDRIAPLVGKEQQQRLDRIRALCRAWMGATNVPEFQQLDSQLGLALDDLLAHEHVVGRRLVDTAHEGGRLLFLCTLVVLVGTGLYLGLRTRGALAAVERLLGRAVQEAEQARAASEARVVERTAELSELAGRLQVTIRSSPVAILAFDAAGRVTLWSPAAERLTGFLAEEVVGQPVPGIGAAGQDEHLWMLEELGAGRSFSALETVRVHRDGEPIPVSISAGPLRDANGAFAGGVALVQDIRARREAERKLQDSERLLRTVLDTVQEGLLGVDAKGAPALVNRAHVRLFGPAAVPLTEMPARLGLYREDRTTLVPADALPVARALEGEAVTGQIVWARAPGETDGRWLSVSAAPLLRDGTGEIEGAVTVARDVTLEREAELRLVDSARRLKSIVATQFDVMTAGFSVQHVIEVVLKKAMRLTPADGGTVQLRQGPDRLVVRAATGSLESLLGLTQRNGDSFPGRAVEEGRFLVCGDAREDDRVNRDACEQLGVRSMVAVPLRHEKETVGALNVSSAEAHAFAIEDVHTLELMGGLIAVAVLRAEQEEALAQRNAERLAAARALEETTARLAESEKRFRRLADAPFDAICLSEAGRIIDANQAMVDLFGWSREELAGRDTMELLAPDERARIRVRVGSPAESAYETVGLRKDGTTFPLRVRGRSVVYDGRLQRLTALEDLTQRRRWQDLLGEQADVLETVLEDVREAVLVFDAQGKVVHLNRAGRQLGAAPGTPPPEPYGELVQRVLNGYPVAQAQTGSARGLRGRDGGLRGATLVVADDEPVALPEPGREEGGVLDAESFRTTADPLLASARELGRSVALFSVELAGAPERTAMHGAALALRNSFRGSDPIGHVAPGAFAVLAVDVDASRAPRLLARVQSELAQQAATAPALADAKVASVVLEEADCLVERLASLRRTEEPDPSTPAPDAEEDGAPRVRVA